MSVIIEDIRNYILKCPFLHDGVLNLDFLPEKVSYSIDAMPAEPYYKKYVDGGGVKQQYFSLTSKEMFGEDVLQNIANSGFCQMFEEWLDDNNENGILPELDGYKAQRIEVTNSGSLLYADVGLGVYQIQCRLLYEKE